MREAYASDISKEKFEEIRSVLEGVRKRTKPTTVDLYEVFCGVLYVLRTACQWRMLPRDFPNWVTVYSYFVKWRTPGEDGVSALQSALTNQVCTARQKLGRSTEPTLLIVDAQSVKNTEALYAFRGLTSGEQKAGSARLLGRVVGCCAGTQRRPSRGEVFPGKSPCVGAARSAAVTKNPPSC